MEPLIRQITLASATGQTLRATMDFGGYLLLRFDDAMVALYSACDSYEINNVTDAANVIGNLRIIDDSKLDELCNNGFVTEQQRQEALAYKAERDAETEDRQKAMRRAQHEELEAEFGDA